MDMQLVVGLLPAILSAVGVWVALNSEVAKLKGRVRHLEVDRDETKQFIREVREALEQIRIMLAQR
jgi:hypothetical protein